MDDLPVGGRKLFRHYDKRIAIFRTESRIYAVDNRCPHQGYALLQGDMKGEQLTCAWHNWKFELDQDGHCSFGGEAVRSYPVLVEGGHVFVDVTDPAAEMIAPSSRSLSGVPPPSCTVARYFPRRSSSHNVSCARVRWRKTCSTLDRSSLSSGGSRSGCHFLTWP